MARFWAVKALFQHDQNHTPAHVLVAEMKTFWLNQEPLQEGAVYHPLDEALFEAIVTCTIEHREAIDQHLIPLLPPDWSWERLDPVLRSVLRAGCGEAYLETSPPAAVLINEYVDITFAFLGLPGTGLVNRILDRALQKTQTS